MLHPGAVAARGLDPELDDRGALGHRLVAEDDHELGVADRRERQPEGVEGLARLFRQDGGVGAEPLAQEPAERVGLLDRLGARERGDDPPPGPCEHPLGLVQRVVPGEDVETAAADAPERVGDAIASL